VDTRLVRSWAPNSYASGPWNKFAWWIQPLLCEKGKEEEEMTYTSPSRPASAFHCLSQGWNTFRSPLQVSTLLSQCPEGHPHLRPLLPSLLPTHLALSLYRIAITTSQRHTYGHHLPLIDRLVGSAPNPPPTKPAHGIQLSPSRMNNDKTHISRSLTSPREK
jgi:hypothetical protein